MGQIMQVLTVHAVLLLLFQERGWGRDHLFLQHPPDCSVHSSRKAAIGRKTQAERTYLAPKHRLIFSGVGIQRSREIGASWAGSAVCPCEGVAVL